jgi:hypothetical protein
VANANRPWAAVRISSAKIQVAAGIDRKILERVKLARRSVDREPFGHGTQVQQQRPVERDGAPHGIHFDVTIGHVTAADAILNDPSSAVFAIEPSCFHVTTDGGIERARGVRGDEKRELNRFKQDGTRSHGLAGPA